MSPKGLNSRKTFSFLGLHKRTRSRDTTTGPSEVTCRPRALVTGVQQILDQGPFLLEGRCESRVGSRSPVPCGGAQAAVWSCHLLRRVRGASSCVLRGAAAAALEALEPGTPHRSPGVCVCCSDSDLAPLKAWDYSVPRGVTREAPAAAPPRSNVKTGSKHAGLECTSALRDEHKST